MSKNLNEEIKKLQDLEDKVCDKVTSFTGSLKFVYAHSVWFGVWILVNLGVFGFLKVKFDPYPFGLLTLIVSLEAIFLSTFPKFPDSRVSAPHFIPADIRKTARAGTSSVK